ncbi:hypothetical protein GCM10009836_51650 [Pseudonocardia ailaonensis]|uniref:Integral membrane protein n=1 Tax=Pseudonocardia ailaonensis TaxID=367279 RepID=A0ABN2NF55_9PSEU
MTAVDPDRSTTTTLNAVRVLATLSVLCIVCQGITAGALLSPGGGGLAVHQIGAIVLHVLTGLTLIAAFLYRRARGGAWWPVVLAGVVFVVTFLQALAGDNGNLMVHVPLALALLVGAVWVAAWSFARR